MKLKKEAGKNNVLMSFDYMTISVFALRVGKNNKEWRVAYGLVVPSPDKMDKPIVTGSTQIGTCEFGKISIRKIIWSGERESVLGIYDDLICGISLKAAMDKWGVDTSKFDYDVTYTQKSIWEEWGQEAILKGQLSYTQTVQMLDPDRLFENGGIIPKDVDKAIFTLEKHLKEQTRLPFGDKYDHVGNMDIVIAPDRDAAGKPLVEYIWEKGSPFVQHVYIHMGLLEKDDNLTVNVVCKEDGRVIRDSIESVHIKEVKDIALNYPIEKCPDSIEIKIWREREGESLVVSDTIYYFLKNICIAAGLIGGKMKIITGWLKEIRKVVPETKRAEVDKSMIIERSEFIHSTIGEPIKKRAIRKKPQKSNDAFFPKGWDVNENEHGLLSFLEWFKYKAKNAKSVFLQDPYFEDVAMYFFASASTSCEYTVLTQTLLKTNPDGTNKEVVEGEENLRKQRILGGIKANPRMFSPMKLVIKDIPITHNVLHDRYLIFDYEDGNAEAYTLSNSLQGATNRQPLLVTQIGDNAFERVQQHIIETMKRDGVETIYNYAEKALSKSKTNTVDKVADGGFLTWLNDQAETIKKGEVDQILKDIFEWRTFDRLTTLGFFLANMTDSEADGIIILLVDKMRQNTNWVKILKEYILKGHYSKFPQGYIDCPYRGWIHNDPTILMGLNYNQIVTSYNAHFLDYIGEEGHSFGVWGQYFVAKMLLRLSLIEYIDVLKQLMPTLLSIETDKTITPCYKVSVMLMSELMEYDYWQKSDDVMRALMIDSEEWLRGIGALVFLQKSQDDSFDCGNFRNLIRDEEVVPLGHAAWGMKPAPAHVEIFYNWLIDAYIKKGDPAYFKECLFNDVLFESHIIEDKADYVKNVALSLIEEGLISKDDLSKSMIDALFKKSISGQDTVVVRDVLPECLPLVDGDINLLLDLSKQTVAEFDEKVRLLSLKNDEDLFYVAKDCIELRVVLIHLVNKYEGKSNGLVDKIKELLVCIDKGLDDYGLGRSKKMFEY